MTERIYATDAYARSVPARVLETDGTDRRILLDRTVFYPGGGGQEPDRGQLRIGDDSLNVVRVTQDSAGVWHWVDGTVPSRGTELVAEIDWDHRYRLMQTHTAMHGMCGVVWRKFHSAVTGGDMRAGEGRLDFEILDWDPEQRQPIEDELNQELASPRLVEVSFLARAEADLDPSLIRTKVSLLPAELTEVRVIDIVGLDRQADGGTHVRSTAEVGRIKITKVESKGKGFRRIRFVLD